MRPQCPLQASIEPVPMRRSGAARSTGRPTSAGSWGSCSETAYAAARSTLDNAGIDPTEKSSRLRTKNVGFRNRKIVASDRQIEVVLECQFNRIPEREESFHPEPVDRMQ